jgi:phospholipid/cholesterol/gamma-HCH transport system substrate-binding protein
MQTGKTLELMVGLFVALGLAAFFMLAMRVSDLTSLGDQPGYTVTATFDNIGSLKVRAPVTVAGVRIGRVTGIDIDQERYTAVVRMTIAPEYNRLPTDTSASILTAGLVGEQYIGLEPGGDLNYLQQGSNIKLTQPAMVLEKLVGRLLTSLVSGDKPGTDKPPANSP